MTTPEDELLEGRATLDEARRGKGAMNLRAGRQPKGGEAPLRILHLHSSDYVGGGGGTVAMSRLHQGLRARGVDSRILCGKKTVSGPDSEAISRKRLARVEHWLRALTKPLGLNDLHHVSSFGVARSRAYKDADLLQIHGTHGFFNYLAIPGLTREKPALFTLHDLWAVSGHCTYSYDCERWRTGCGHCPHLDTHPPVKRDNTRLEWKLKRWVYERSNLTIVSVSPWTTEVAKASLLQQFRIAEIPYGVDVDAFQPLDREYCRKVLGIPKGRRVLMFVALRIGETRKGADLLLRALEGLPASLKSETVLVMLGEGGEQFARTAGVGSVDLGYVRNDRLKAIAYSAADAFVLPTRAETTGLVFLEAMACGTPSVSFRVGGVPSVVRPGVTGLLAEPENANQLRDRLVELLEDDGLRASMSEQCRTVATTEYSLDLQVERHMALYRELLGEAVG
jgi:glycosyltransferase involved in cell wall biosynthesis